MIGRISPMDRVPPGRIGAAFGGNHNKGALYDFNVNGAAADWKCEHCGRIRSLTRDDIGEHLTHETVVKCSDGMFHFHKLVV